MFKEYALDPALLKNWKDFRYFTEKMGISQGRLISQYPKRWKRLVYEGLNEGVGEVERLRIAEALSGIDDKLLRRGGGWSNAICWLENAENEHRRNAFAAILSVHNPKDSPYVLIGDEIHDGVDAWSGIVQAYADRQPETMAETVAPLLRNGREIVFVDPHFSPDNPRFRVALAAFLRVLTENSHATPRIQLMRKAKGSIEWFEDECKKRMPRLVPKGLKLEVITLDEKHGGEKLHDRFILTDRWGVQFSVGLDAGSSGQKTLITLLSESVWQATYNKYCSESPAFGVIGTSIIVEGAG